MRIDFLRTESWPKKQAEISMQAFSGKKSQFLKFSEKGITPVVVIQEALDGPSLQIPGGIEGLDRGQAAGGIAADFADPWVGGTKGCRKGAADRRPVDAGFEPGKQAPGAVEEKDRKSGVGLADDGGVEAEEQVAGGVESESVSGSEEGDVGAAAERFQAALGLALAGMAYDDIAAVAVGLHHGLSEPGATPSLERIRSTTASMGRSELSITRASGAGRSGAVSRVEST